MDYGARPPLNVDLFTANHRISGVINSRNRTLFELLNDGTTSLLELSKAFISRLTSPGDIVSSSSSPVLIRKNTLLFAALPVPEKAITERNLYSMYNKHLYHLLVTAGDFEVTGVVETLGKADHNTLLTQSGDFIALNKATAVLVAGEPVTFEGEIILVNKAQIGLLTVVQTE